MLCDKSLMLSVQVDGCVYMDGQGDGLMVWHYLTLNGCCTCSLVYNL